VSDQSDSTGLDKASRFLTSLLSLSDNSSLPLYLSPLPPTSTFHLSPLPSTSILYLSPLLLTSIFHYHYPPSHIHPTPFKIARPNEAQPRQEEEEDEDTANIWTSDEATNATASEVSDYITDKINDYKEQELRGIDLFEY
jgi:hypothetical protein